MMQKPEPPEVIEKLNNLSEEEAEQLSYGTVTKPFKYIKKSSTRS
jgi:hypothetical protein